MMLKKFADGKIAHGDDTDIHNGDFDSTSDLINKEFDASSSDELASFPQTYIVIKFRRNVEPKAISWLVDKIKSLKRDGGAELVVRRQPMEYDQGLVLHITASKIKFLELAEDTELVKQDRRGVMREFSVDQMDEFFEDGMSVEDFLTIAERQTLVRHELDNVRALPEDTHVPGYHYELYEGQSILQLYISKGLVMNVFPLHDQEMLQKLGKKWYLSLFSKQPFEEIRLYFGDGIALYFTFIGFYSTALLVPMALGFVQLLFASSKTVAFFCIFNVIWVTVFLEAWKRRCSELAYKWGTIGMTSLDEPRPNYHGQMGIDKVSGRLQPQFPRWKTYVRMYLVSLPIVFVCLFIAFDVMLAAFWVEDFIRKHVSDRDDFWVYSVYTPSVVYAVTVYVMNRYYRRLATYLTEWENHRTQSQYDRHRVAKLVLFEFVNNFVSMFYIAFIIQDMDMLKMQLAIMLIILQLINNFQEALLPLLKRFYIAKINKLKDYMHSKSPNDKKKIRDTKYDLPKDFLESVQALSPDDPAIQAANIEGTMEVYEGTYDDYLEMYIQFGYVMLFSSVYPIAAFWAVLNNIFEIRGDAFKLCMVYQRPMGRRVKDTGAWQKAFEAVGTISIMTNCGLLCLSQKSSEGMTMDWVMSFVLLEHCLLFLRHVLNQAIPDRPEWVRVALARRAHESKQALKHEKSPQKRRMLTRRFKTVHGPHQKKTQ